MSTANTSSLSSKVVSCGISYISRSKYFKITSEFYVYYSHVTLINNFYVYIILFSGCQ